MWSCFTTFKYFPQFPVIDPERCLGCRLCLEACPEGCIIFEDPVADKCVLCLDADVLIPACIEACPSSLLKVEISRHH
ncbi:4Fe-4S binding protein [Methanothermobacter sp.]|uniref:4Fe-4S binding protein n=1 Tax=Methanothermobacter sp. TaxID=1884223 RepID=UPI003C7512BB